MCCDKCESQFVGYCIYCKNEIWSDEKYIKTDKGYYHHDTKNNLHNCYFPELEEK